MKGLVSWCLCALLARGLTVAGMCVQKWVGVGGGGLPAGGLPSSRVSLCAALAATQALAPSPHSAARPTWQHLGQRSGQKPPLAQGHLARPPVLELTLLQATV